MKKVELLAPAGNMACLKAAVLAGCDAVYLGGKLFGARGFAGNFNNEELIEAINYAHLYGVKVYLTINTIVYEREVNAFIDYVRFAHQNNVDAVIIQDLGMLDLVKKKFPNLEVHASTQMHVHNYDGALVAKRLGIKRVVMARETPLEVIKKIKNEIGIEVEVFVHGALCVSYSGQCLMSALIGNRSGNRGTCAQVCRKPYNLYDKNGKKLNHYNYLLSTKDLCTLNYLDEIIASGVDSLKIEGRMKRAHYVYLVTSIYRRVIDNYYETGKIDVTKDDVLELKKMFNREFTKGFMLGEANDAYVNQKRPNHQGVSVGRVVSYKNGYLTIRLTSNINVNDGLRIIGKKNDFGILVNNMYVNKKLASSALKGTDVAIKYDGNVEVGSEVVLTTDSNQLKNIDNELKLRQRKVMINAWLVARHDKPLFIKVSDGVNEVSYELKDAVKKAVNHPVTKDFIIKQIAKTGNTVYTADKIFVDLDDNVFLSVKDVNDLRRRALSLLDEKRLYKIPFTEDEYHANPPAFESFKSRSCLLETVAKYEENKEKYDVIYTTNKALLKCPKVVLKLPRVISNYDKGVSKAMVGELGGLMQYKTFDTDFSFNVVNSYTVCFLHELRAGKITLSPELTLSQTKALVDAYHERYHKHPNLEVITKGYEEAMVCRFDLNKMYKINEGFLEDEYQNLFKVKQGEGFMTIYNHEEKRLNENDYYDAGVNVTRVNLL